MKTNKAVVRTNGQIVDAVDVQEFESIQEALDFLGDKDGDETRTLALINAQHKANVTNAARAKHTKVDPADMKAFRAWKASQK